MALEINGTLVKVMPEVSGTSKSGSAWRKQEFVIETPDQFPKKVCFSMWGDKVNDLRQYTTGDQLKVSFNLESRDYNDRWYTEARAWRIELADSGEVAQPAAPISNYSTPKNPVADLPPTFSEDGADELPF